MNVFVIHPDISRSCKELVAASFDHANKQLVECCQILDLSIDGKHIMRKNGTPLTIEDLANLEEAYAAYMKEAEQEQKLARERREQAIRQEQERRKAEYDKAAAPIREARRIKLEKKFLASQKGKP